MTPENGKSLVQSYNCFDKVVIVDTAHKIGKEVLTNLKKTSHFSKDLIKEISGYLWTDAGKDKLEQVQDTGARVGPAQVLEYQVRAEISRLQLSPENVSSFIFPSLLSIRYSVYR